MSEQKHTPGPYEVRYSNKKNRYVVDAIRRITRTYSTAWTVCHVCDGGGPDLPAERANAERIAACLNACEGIENPAAVKDLIRTANALVVAAERSTQWVAKGITEHSNPANQNLGGKCLESINRSASDLRNALRHAGGGDD